MITAHKFSVGKTAHCFTLNELTDQTKCLWLCCHGYGQQADRFIKKFDVLDPARHFFIAPEALNSFYWHEKGREPVASWMTSRHRDDQIADYLAYLHDVYTHFNSLARNHIWILFGFSQGCATIIRYAFQSQPKLRHLILWAGDFPKDVNYQNLDLTSSIQITHVVGDQDRFLKPGKYAEEQDFVSDQGLDVRFNTFTGSHRIDKKVLSEIVAALQLDPLS